MDDFDPEAEITGSFLDRVREGYRRFWSMNMLAPSPGTNEPGCPPNTVRTDVPRSNVFDPDDPNNKGFRPLAFGKKYEEKKESDL